MVIDAGSQTRRVLLIEDDAGVRMAIRALLERSGYELDEASGGRDGVRRALSTKFDVVILDLGLPEYDGWTVLDRLRELSDVPILVLTGRSSEFDVARALMAGADDYVVKPFRNTELLARLHAVIRRAPSSGEEPPRHLRDGDLEIDLESRRVRVAGEEIELSRTEFALLSALVRNVDVALSNRDLLAMAWNDHTGIGTDRVKFTVLRLRRKIGDRHGARIEPVRGHGYRWLGGDQVSGQRA